jgi:hypothetical protein
MPEEIVQELEKIKLNVLKKHIDAIIEYEEMEEEILAEHDEDGNGEWKVEMGNA